MDNELLFEHLINENVSKCLMWADLYRGASNVASVHKEYNIGEVAMCMIIALYKLKNNYQGNKLNIIEECYNLLLADYCSFETIDEIIERLHKEHIIF